MDITLLYDSAYKMLAETNVYSRPPEQFIYHDHLGEEYALLELVRSHPMIGSKRMSSDKRGGIKINNAKCYQAIAEAMVKYADSYPAPASFKKRMRENFVRWLEAIRSKYEFPEQPEIPWGLYPEDGEKDTLFQTATLLQALQRNYDEHESTVSSYLAVDIWSQLSDYARERIEYVFTAGNPDFAAFIEMLKDETPDGRIPAYRTEREMFVGDESISERLLYYMKADRVCPKLCLEIEGTERKLGNVRITMQGRSAYGNSSRKRAGISGDFLYIAITEQGAEVVFEEKDVIDIL